MKVVWIAGKKPPDFGDEDVKNIVSWYGCEPEIREMSALENQESLERFLDEHPGDLVVSGLIAAADKLPMGNFRVGEPVATRKQQSREQNRGSFLFFIPSPL